MVQQQRGSPWAAGLALVLVTFSPATVVLAGEVEVVAVEVRHQQGDRFSFAVTLRHGDTGWEHYADAWEVLGPQGEVLARRVLAHPHVDEQPFTRSLRGVEVPRGVREVQVRGHDKRHGSGPAKTVLIPDR